MKANRRLRMVMSTGLVLLFAVALLALAPAASRGDNPWSYPFISGVSPPSAPVGSLITINGSDFFDSPGSVTLGSVAPARADIVSWSETRIEAIVPQDAYGGCVTVTRSNGDAYEFISFYVEATVTSVFPTIAVPGQIVTVKGGGFGDGGPSTEVQLHKEVGATTVKGMNLTQLTNTQIKFKASDIPEGTYQLYVSTYVSTVTTFRIESNRTTFTVEGNPVLGSASPNPCPAGATLTVKGSGFGEVKDSDFNIELYDPSTGESYDDFDFFEWTRDSVKFNTLPSFKGQFKIIVSRGMSCPSPPRQAAQGSNEIEVTFTGDPVPPEDIVGQTSRTWGHDSIGTTSPARDWYLAEASTAPGEESWILVQNPNGTPANVTLTYVTASAVNEMPPDVVEANSRKT
ncbi:MAG: IPT/TIG domain-containing protein [Actinobacteria bacterium]|nr:IPT/TIG domain-containing protein [Actinomycetota bacterium]